MGLHFIYQGARSGEPGILATFQENQSQLARIVASFGWSIEDENVHVLHRTLVDMNIDEWVYELLDLAEKTGAKRIVIDSLPDLDGGCRGSGALSRVDVLPHAAVHAGGHWRADDRRGA